MNKKRLLFLMILSFMLGLTGCKKNGGTDAAAATTKNYVYSMQDITGFEAPISQVLKGGDEIYAYGFKWTEEADNATIAFYQMDSDTSLSRISTIATGVNESYNSFQMDSQGNIYCIKNVYGNEYDDGVEEDQYRDDYYLVKMKFDGTEFFSVKLNDIPELKKRGDENGYFYAGNLILDESNGLYISCVDTYAKFDLDGNYQKIVADNQSPISTANLIPLSDGRMAALVYDDTGMSIALADMEAGTIGESNKIPGASYEFSFYPGVGYDLFMVNNYGLYGYNIGDTDKKQIMSYIDSDFGFYNIYSIIGINDKEFIAMYDDEETGMGKLARFTKVEPEDVKEKKIISLAMANSDWSVRRAVVKFNKANENYRITITDYSSLYATETDYDAGVTKLNTDIVSGKIPDIILLDNSMPVDSYVSKGLFEDLKPFIAKDNELDINNYMPNVMEAFSQNGKLYSLVPSYSIQTLIAKTSDVGEERGWTIEEAMDILAKKPQGTQFTAMVRRDEILRNSMTMSGNQFVDWKTGKCNFDSDGFIELLEFLNTFPETIDDSKDMDEYWNNYEALWREGKVLTLSIHISDFRNYNYYEKGTFGEKVTIKGFPTDGGDGSVIVPNLQLAMSSKSKIKDGAWEFLRVFLSDEYQQSDDLWGLPLSIKRLETMAKEATQKPYYEDENGQKIEYDDTYYLSGMEIIIDPMTQEECDAFKQQLYTFTQVYNENDALLRIVEEEAAPYFAGQKTAKDVANVIQSRAQIYVSENR